MSALRIALIAVVAVAAVKWLSGMIGPLNFLAALL